MPIIVAINKIDKDNADVDAAMEMIYDLGIDLDDTPIVPISALKVGLNANLFPN